MRGSAPVLTPDEARALLDRIERVFAKIKALRRKANARSIEDVDAAFGVLLDECEPDKWARYFSAARYQSTLG